MLVKFYKIPAFQEHVQKRNDQAKLFAIFKSIFQINKIYEENLTPQVMKLEMEKIDIKQYAQTFAKSLNEYSINDLGFSPNGKIRDSFRSVIHFLRNLRDKSPGNRSKAVALILTHLQDAGLVNPDEKVCEATSQSVYKYNPFIGTPIEWHFE